MEKQDARSLPGEAQEDLRRRVVEAVQKGLSQTKAAGVFGVARGTVSRWMGLVERAGRRALKAQRRGRPPVSRLVTPIKQPRRCATFSALARTQLNLPFALWTREAVQQLLSRKSRSSGFCVDGGALFANLGATPQKPVCDERTSKILWPCGNGWRKSTHRFADRRDGSRPKFIGWTRWTCVGITKRDAATDAADRRRWCSAPASVFAATLHPRNYQSGGDRPS